MSGNNTALLSPQNFLKSQYSPHKSYEIILRRLIVLRHCEWPRRETPAATPMAGTTLAFHVQPLSSNCRILSKYSSINSHLPITTMHQRCRTTTPLLRLERGRNSVHGARAWGANPRSGMVMGDYGDDIDEDDDDDDEEEEEEEDRSLDLLIRFVENVFRKVSRKARKAVKSVLPVPISTKLVRLVDQLISF
ncbi:UNVERIFIED_CONTAM: hypothetical protein Sangu_0625700 [Sesamum angustifolium]|uniref:Uncharacterized protein n=1 Tax=Sesamum angustifolium TaxID=2727405 RepID=A0AAW2QCE7_9LAMI